MAFHCENSSKTHALNSVFTAKADYMYLTWYPYCESSYKTHAQNGVLTENANYNNSCLKWRHRCENRYTKFVIKKRHEEQYVTKQYLKIRNRCTSNFAQSLHLNIINVVTY